jgi:hypothetical protein
MAIHEGCYSCEEKSFDSNNLNHCTACLPPLYLNDGMCIWDECEKITVAQSGASCEKCIDSWGLLNGNCHKCPSHLGWAGCSSCSLD